VVTDFDAHSWVEVYFRHIGWFRSTPTPGAAPASSRAVAAGSAAALPEAGDADEARTDRRSSASGTATPGHDAPRPAGGSGNPLLLLERTRGGCGRSALIAAGWVLLRARRHRALSPAAAQRCPRPRATQRPGAAARAPGTGATLLSIERGLRTLRGEAVAGYAARLRASRYAAHAPTRPRPPSGAGCAGCSAAAGACGPAARVHLFPAGGPRP
jgi:hypothetical protein